MATRNCPGMDSVIKPMDTIPEDKKVRVQRTQRAFDPFEKPTNQVKRVHSENNICINFNKSSSAGRQGEWKVGSPEGGQAAGRRYTFNSYQEPACQCKRLKRCGFHP
ncbi:hypothetical protein FD755_017544 [Muntiacus reevesi]|uniref:Uncharacterized protein n=1 Tax=Muntiacus reevesi TaxID=9886 RepID=A0A5N3XBV1_MUNRE|nr:hypothetical protein FD755_017544 [Muntiacus reevesi]